jgi:hypothetical protein
MEASTIVVRPAAGPLTLREELLKNPITTPPTMPAIIPLTIGAPEANAIPRHKGSATKNTTMAAGISYFKLESGLK